MTHERRARIGAFLARPEIAAVLAALDGGGEESRIVGGAVRNLLLGEAASDIDIATTALPQETVRRAEAAGYKTIPTGIDHGTVTLLRDGASFEVTTLRSDIETDGRRAVVAFGRDFAQDARRRDFTINALSLDATGEVHDPVGGLADLATRRVRFIGDAGSRIREDYLRILRFFRFHAHYGVGEPDPEGLAACIAGREGLSGLSRERVRAEMMKLLVARGAAGVVDAMARSGLLMPVIGTVPHLSRFAAMACGGASPDMQVHPAFRLAALAVGVAEDALLLRERLRLSNAEYDRIDRIARALEALSGRAQPHDIALLRHAARRVGADAVAAALVLLAASGPAQRQAQAHGLIAVLGLTPDFLPRGADVIALGVPRGPLVGRVLEAAQFAWVEAGCPADAGAQAAFVAAAAAEIALPS